MLSRDAYGPNLATTEHGAKLELSSPPDVGAVRLCSGASSGYRFIWQDGTVLPIDCALWRSGRPWLQVDWPEPRRLTDVVLRMPVLILMPEARRRVAELSVEHRDATTGDWRPIAPTNGQQNPTRDWIAPTVPDGTQSRSYTFAPVTTDGLRVRFLAGNAEGWCFLESVGAYSREPATAPFSMSATAAPGSDAVLEPGDECVLTCQVTDATGRAVFDCPVRFAPLAGEGTVTRADARTDRTGRAEAAVRTGPREGVNAFSATTGDASIRFEVRTVSRDEALAIGLSWLQSAAAEHQRGSRVTAFDGTVMYTPDGVGSYDGFWARDFQYMIEGYAQGIPLEHVRKGFEYLVTRQRADGAMPNKVLKSGEPVFCPGPGCDSVFGPLPPPDNPQFMVKIADHHARLSGDPTLFAQYREQLVRGMEFLPRSPSTSLLYIPSENPSSPYGFSDAIAKTGDQLFDSLLYIEAARILARLHRRVGDKRGARRWTTEAAGMERDLQTLYDKTSGMFLAASVDCRQIDVWGSAYAAHIGAIPEEQRRAVAEYLVTSYDGIVRRGQVRHTAPGEYWQRTIVPNVDVYQNGTYWAIPSGWVASVIATVDRELARQMLLDLVKDYQRNGINEAINPDVGYVAIPNYVASATNPIPALSALAPRRAGSGLE